MRDRDCACCASVSRRDFLCGGALVVAAVVVLPVDLVAALRVNGGEAVYPIPTRDGAGIDRDRAVILARYQGVLYAFVLWCPHQHTALRWMDDAQRFECPKHHSKYQPNGLFIEGRATRGMDRYALRRQGDTVVVDLATVYQQDRDRAAWETAVLQL